MVGMSAKVRATLDLKSKLLKRYDEQINSHHFVHLRVQFLWSARRSHSLNHSASHHRI
jgi:hypothetical protein